ncbi:MAG: 3-dehydroquinate synthase [Sphingomonadales bacterium]|nr:3-dehydroquinate synthase [Sphingomonadales bacterium]
MSCVRVGLGEQSYDIVIEPGAIRNAAEYLGSYIRGRRLVIVTERNVADNVLPMLSEGLKDVALETIVLDPGETTKSWHQLERLCDGLLNAGIERSDHIVALGGGVIGDLTGFAAAVIKRGCHFIQIPTSLLAQVDSSVGGKTAINCRAGKNLIGAFHQPVLVLIDPETLDTLPPREMRAGYAEVVKYGLIAASLIAGDRTSQMKAIETSVRAKAAIVEADERETLDRRALLNLGHTFGHALEAETGFSDRLLHGEAVAAGMALAFRYSARLGYCTKQDAERVSAHLRAVGLPEGPAAAGVEAKGSTLVGHMLHDKKMTGGTLPFILVRGIGQAYVDKSVSLADVAEFLDADAL